MPYVPRLYDELFQSLLARVVTQSKLTDVSPGSVLTHLLGTVAQEIELAEYRLEQIRDSFDFDNASGSDLDLRIQDLPLAQIWRKEASKASGEVMRLTLVRLETSPDELEIPAGLIYKRSDNEDVSYIQTATVFVDMTVAPSGGPWVVDATHEYPDPNNPLVAGIRVLSTAAGTIGNASKDIIDLSPVGAPDEIVASTNVFPCIGGTDGESDAALKARARNYLGALSRITSAALMYIAKTFSSTDGTTFKHVSVYEPVEVKGYTELLVDPGSANLSTGATLAQNYSKSSAKTIYSWPYDSDPPPYFTHEAPSVEDLTDDNVLLGGFWEGWAGPEDWESSLVYYPLSHPKVRQMFGIPDGEKFVLSIGERGILYLNTDYKIKWSDVSADTQIAVWGQSINFATYGHLLSIGSDENPVRVYIGALAEFQAIIEGDPSDPVAMPGYRPAGTRVRVVLPTTQFVTGGVSLDITYAVGADIEAAGPEVLNRVLYYAAELGPGDPLLVAELYSTIMAIDGIINVHVKKPLNDVWPIDARHSLRIDPDEIDLF